MTSSIVCVDLDGTLINTDTLYEKAFIFMRSNPLRIFLLLIWLFQGKAFLKQQLASRVTLPVHTLPYNQIVIDWLREQKTLGKKIILATACDQKTARAIAEHLGFFDDVVASDGICNLKSHQKAALLNQRFGQRNYDYIGNDHADLAVWAHAKQAILVSASTKLIKKIKKIATLVQHFKLEATSPILLFFKAMRIHQYAKNTLLFVPIITAHIIFNLSAWLSACLGGMSFCLMASSVYILNDLCDLSADRQHPRKHKRPIAMGHISIPQSLLLMAGCFLGSWLCAWPLALDFKIILGIYYICTLFYSFRLKHLLFLDTITLACLYTLRIIAGMALLPTSIYSIWLLLFSMFLFLSLAFLKRVSELRSLEKHGQQQIIGRAYTFSHTHLIMQFGIVSGFLGILILALYFNSPTAIVLYSYPQCLLLLFPLFTYWLCRMWWLANEGKVLDDPVLFAIKDKVSYLCGSLALLIMLLSS